jgi:Reverse transcriptase (RNA-dependent DNA polymerase)
MKAAKLAEMKGLLDKGVFEIVLRDDIPPGANTLSDRYVLAIKDGGTSKERYKARFVVQGHKVLEKKAIVHDASAVSQRGIRLVFALAAIFGWKLWTEDVRQAFIQTAGTLLRNVYLVNLRGAEAELHLRPEQALRLLKPLYGLADAGDLWHAEFSDHHREILRMEELDSEPALYAKFQADFISGMTGLYVDDTVSAGTHHFEKWSAAKNPYETQSRTFNEGDVLGQQFSRNPTTGRITVSQEKYARTLQVLEHDSSFS